MERLVALRAGCDSAERLLDALPVESAYPTEAGAAFLFAGILVGLDECSNRTFNGFLARRSARVNGSMEEGQSNTLPRALSSQPRHRPFLFN